MPRWDAAPQQGCSGPRDTVRGPPRSHRAPGLHGEGCARCVGTPVHWGEEVLGQSPSGRGVRTSIACGSPGGSQSAGISTALRLGLQGQRAPNSLPARNIPPAAELLEPGLHPSRGTASQLGLLHPCQGSHTHAEAAASQSRHCIPARAAASQSRFCIPGGAPTPTLGLLHPLRCPRGSGRAEQPSTRWLVPHQRREVPAWRGTGEAEHSPAGAGAGSPRGIAAQSRARAMLRGADLLPKS